MRHWSAICRWQDVPKLAHGRIIHNGREINHAAYPSICGWQKTVFFSVVFITHEMGKASCSAPVSSPFGEHERHWQTVTFQMLLVARMPAKLWHQHATTTNTTSFHFSNLRFFWRFSKFAFPCDRTTGIFINTKTINHPIISNPKSCHFRHWQPFLSHFVAGTPWQLLLATACGFALGFAFCSRLRLPRLWGQTLIGDEKPIVGVEEPNRNVLNKCFLRPKLWCENGVPVLNEHSGCCVVSLKSMVCCTSRKTQMFSKTNKIHESLNYSVKINYTIHEKQVSKAWTWNPWFFATEHFTTLRLARGSSDPSPLCQQKRNVFDAGGNLKVWIPANLAIFCRFFWPI